MTAKKHPADALRKLLTAALVAKEHSLRDAAADIGCSYTAVGNWMEGVRVPPLRFLAGIARYLSITQGQAIDLRDAARDEPVRMTTMNRRRR